MVEKIEEILRDNAKEYYRNGIISEGNGEYNSAVTLFFKALIALTDLYVFVREGKVPSSHTERFRILEKNYSEIYLMIDKNFSFYQDSYTLKMNKEACEVIRKDVEKLFEITS